jgi:hypothetical protein
MDAPASSEEPDPTGRRSAAYLPTGFDVLNRELPGGGWPRSSLIDWLLVGDCEWALLGPMLSAASSNNSILCLEHAPASGGGRHGTHGSRDIAGHGGHGGLDPYAPALQHRHGIEPHRLLKVSAPSFGDAAWAAEQGLRSNACAAVLWWLDDAVSAQVSATSMTTACRRLNLAAQEGATPIVLLRPWSNAVQGQSLPAPLRLRLERQAPDQLSVQIFKRQGPAMAQPLTLPNAAIAESHLRRWRALTSSQAQGRSATASKARPSSLTAPPTGHKSDALVRHPPERLAA